MASRPHQVDISRSTIRTSGLCPSTHRSASSGVAHSPRMRKPLSRSRSILRPPRAIARSSTSTTLVVSNPRPVPERRARSRTPTTGALGNVSPVAWMTPRSRAGARLNVALACNSSSFLSWVAIRRWAPVHTAHARRSPVGHAGSPLPCGRRAGTRVASCRSSSKLQLVVRDQRQRRRTHRQRKAHQETAPRNHKHVRTDARTRG